jgi:hypothetical protein
MVNAMHEEKKALGAWAWVFGLPVEEKTVQQIFYQRPDGLADKEGDKHVPPSAGVLLGRAPNQKADQRQKYHQYSDRADMCKELKEVRFEQADGFFLFAQVGLGCHR